jgi:PAS domain S-box-containing protein
MQGVFNNRLDNPDLNAYVLNFWDITELRKTQQAISESEKKYYDIFNAFPDIYFRIDMRGIITEISPSVSSIAGFDRNEVVNNSIFDFVELDMDWEKARKILYRLKHVKDFGLTLRTKNRKKIYCSLNVNDVKNHLDEIIGFEGVLRDISGRVVAEKQLKQSEHELKESNASKDKILSIIGHDLLGPIGTQKSILDMVIDDVEDFSREEILRLLQTMKPSLDATFTMIENLLSWARIMRRSIKPSLKQNNLSLIIGRSFDLLEQQAEQKKIKLIYSGDKEVFAVFDKNLIEIAIRNLLSNAIKFSNSDSEIRVDAVRMGNEVEVSVSDQGMGLSEEGILKILKEKEKMESRLGTQKEKGTGLGLIVVKEFIQLNNGELQIKSKPGQGTTFSFMLPVA